MPDSIPNIIIGIDPSSLHVGYSVVSVGNDSVYPIEYGTFEAKPSQNKTSNLDYSRFYSLYTQVTRMALEWINAGRGKVHVAVEECYIGSGYQSAIALATARGIQLLPFIVMAHTQDWLLYEYSPATVKKVAAGHGHASKSVMIATARRLYNIPDDTKLSEHAADALLIAYTHWKMHSNEWKEGKHE